MPRTIKDNNMILFLLHYTLTTWDVHQMIELNEISWFIHEIIERIWTNINVWAVYKVQLKWLSLDLPVCHLYFWTRAERNRYPETPSSRQLNDWIIVCTTKLNEEVNKCEEYLMGCVRADAHIRERRLVYRSSITYCYSVRHLRTHVI